VIERRADKIRSIRSAESSGFTGIGLGVLGDIVGHGNATWRAEVGNPSGGLRIADRLVDRVRQASVGHRRLWQVKSWKSMGISPPPRNPALGSTDPV
jgi:hypothetical protein